MKPLKTLVLAACLVGAVTSFAGAKDVKTIAGSMSVPNTVTVATASTTDSVDIIKFFHPFRNGLRHVSRKVQKCSAFQW